MRMLLAVVVFSAVSVASADAVPAGGWMTDCPPTTCPSGSNPYGGSHGSCSIGCAPGQACRDDADCERYYDASFRCEPTRFCIQLVHGGNSANDVVRGECRPDDTCAQPDDDPVFGGREPIRCELTKRCIFHEELVASTMSSMNESSINEPSMNESSINASRDEDSGCAASGRSAASGSVLLVFLLVRRRS